MPCSYGSGNKINMFLQRHHNEAFKDSTQESPTWFLGLLASVGAKSQAFYFPALFAFLNIFLHRWPWDGGEEHFHMGSRLKINRK